MPQATAPSELSALDMKEIQAVLTSENISVFFQPVVSVRSKSILGFEAFSRSVSGDGARLDARDLFGRKWDPKTRLDLCRMCRRKALEAFRPIFERHQQMLLFLNTDGGALSATQKNGDLEAISQAMAIPGKRVVIELERPYLNSPDVSRFVLYYRERGFGLSVDLCGGMGVPAEELFSLKPDFIKFDRQLFTDVEGQEFKRDMVQSMIRLASRLGSTLIAKNVETEDEALRLLEWGVNHQQGYFYTKDKDSTERDPIRAFQQKVEEINRRYRESAQADVAAKRKRYEDFHKVLKKVAYKLADTREMDFASACERVVASEESLAALLTRRAQVRSTTTAPAVEPNPDLFKPKEPVNLDSPMPGKPADPKPSPAPLSAAPASASKPPGGDDSTTSRLLEAKRKAQRKQE